MDGDVNSASDPGPDAVGPRRGAPPRARVRYAVSLGGRVLGALGQTAVIALLARSLGIEDFAAYAVVFSIGQVVVVVCELGFGARVLRLSRERDPRGVLGALLVSRLLVVSALAVLAALSIHAQQERAPLLLAVVLYVSGESFGDLAVAILQGERRSYSAVAVLLVRRSIALVPFLFGLTPSDAVIALVLAGVLGWLALGVIAGRRAGRPASMRSLVGANGPIALTTIATGLTQSDTAVVALVADATLTALYAAAARLSNPVNLAVTTLLQVLIPELASLELAERYGVFVKARRAVLVIAALLAASSVLAPVVVTVLYGRGFGGAAPILAGVLVGAGFSAIAQIHLAWLVVAGLRFRVPLQLAAVIVAGLGLLLVAVQTFGAPGGGVAIALVQVTIAVVVVVEWRRTTTVLRRATVPPA